MSLLTSGLGFGLGLLVTFLIWTVPPHDLIRLIILALV